MTRRRVCTGQVPMSMIVAMALAAHAGVSTARPTGHRPEDDEYDHSQHTGGRRDYDRDQPQVQEDPGDTRPEWQKIGDRKGRSRPNKSRR